MIFSQEATTSPLMQALADATATGAATGESESSAGNQEESTAAAPSDRAQQPGGSAGGTQAARTVDSEAERLAAQAAADLARQLPDTIASATGGGGQNG